MVGVPVQLVLAITQHIFPGRGVGDLPRPQVEVPDALAGACQRKIPAPLRLRDSLLGTLLRVDVLDLRNEMDRSAADGVADDGTGKPCPDERLVLFQIALLE